ncbi:MAG: helix-turn-helix transcriptional regulator [Bryobacteraceae bacterium]|nr:helix-turn-helix transcriptional regulator [Bryobacteraceae bacterium]
MESSPSLQVGPRLRHRGSKLSPRQVRIVELVARGLGDKQIAAELGISEETVAFHFRSAFRRYGARSRAALVASYLAESGPDDGVPPYPNV